MSAGTGIVMGPTGFRPDGPGKLACEECGDWAHLNPTGKSWCVHRWPGEPEDVETYVPDPSCTCTGTGPKAEGKGR